MVQGTKRGRSQRKSSISLLITSALISGCSCDAFRAILPTTRRERIPTFTLATSSPNDGDSDRWRQTASKLRSEVKVAEEALKKSRAGNVKMPAVEERVAPAEYFDLADSCWEITYRFSYEPASKTDNEVDKKKTLPRKNYGGKLEVKFREDGYTDALTPPSDTEVNGGPRFQKVWGWDRETSTEDSLEYLLFSADISLPPPVSSSERFYFQARVEREEGNNKSLSLYDGSITVKRNVEGPPGGWWGIFRGAESILAQFREVGTFRCCPIPKQ